MANKRVDDRPLSIVYKRHPKPFKDVVSTTEGHIYDTPMLIISVVMSSMLEPSKINKGNLSSYWT
jgi:hypothetical protein